MSESPVRHREDLQIADAPSRWSRLWQPFWAVPLALTLMALLLGLGLPLVEKNLAGYLPFIFEGGPDGARSVLSTISSAMISVTGLVFSITIVVMQLASSQFSPRVLAGFLSSRITQVTLGVFTGTFVYALAVLRVVRGGPNQTGTFVPQVSVSLAFALVLASVAMFLAFIHDITTSIQVSRVIARIGGTTTATVQDLYPDPDEPTDCERCQQLSQTPRDSELRWPPPMDTPSIQLDARDRHGRVAFVDHGQLLSLGEKADCAVEVGVSTGQTVVEGQPIARIWGIEPGTEASDVLDVNNDVRSLERRFASAIGIRRERSSQHEVGYGVRQLVDIAERALSPGINDPTTAVQVIDQLHRILRLLVQRPTPSPLIVDDQGTVRVVHQMQSVESLIDLAIEEIAHYGKDSVQVPRTLCEMLDDLIEVSLPRHLPRLRTWRHRLSPVG